MSAQAADLIETNFVEFYWRWGELAAPSSG
jgi:hypothetical protein